MADAVSGLLRRRWLLVGSAVLIAAGLSGYLVASAISGARSGPTEPSKQAGTAAPRPATFAYLAAQHTNSCGLQAAQLAALPGRTRLQGSCCSPMDESTYEAQLAGLRRYANVRQIPADPYDIPVSLARRLIGYGTGIQLTPSQQATYRQATQMSREKGPCCCHCWRWTAFHGMSDYLIARRDWQAKPLAHLIGLVDGCGGKADVNGVA